MELIDLLRLLTVIGTISCADGVDTKMKVNEDDDAILSCSLGTADIKNAVFGWQKDVDHNKKDVFFYSQGRYYGHGQTGQDPQFKGRVFHFPDQLQFGNASIVIRKTKTSDSGNYSCYSIPSFQPEIQSNISLTVGAAPKPSVTNLNHTKDAALLQCEVLGASPKPEVVWTDSDGKILPADEPKVTEREANKYDTVLRITVTKTDNYTCVATQKEISHQINSTIYVYFSDGTSNTGLKVLIGVAVGLILTLGVQKMVDCYRKRRYQGGAKLVVIAGSDVILPCSIGTEQNIEPAMFVWLKDGRQDVFWYDNGSHSNNGREGQDKQFKGRVSHFSNELINGNASIIIKKTRPSDSGIYTCTFPNLQQQTFHVELVVEKLQKTRKQKESDERHEEVKLTPA